MTQCFVPGPMFFSMHIKLLSNIMDSHSTTLYSFADDLRLYMSPPDKTSQLLPSMQSCISDMNAWAIIDMLMINGNKADQLLVISG